MIVQTDDVTGIGIFHQLAFSRQKGNGIMDLDFSPQAQMAYPHAPLKMPRTDTQKGNAITVLRIHIGLYLEHEARKTLLRRRDLPRRGRAR